MRPHLDQLQVNRHCTLKIMPLLLNSAKYCWYHYFCVVLLPCGVDPNVIPAPPGSNPSPVHSRPSGSWFSHPALTSGCVVLVQHRLLRAGKPKLFTSVSGVLQGLATSPVPRQLFISFSFLFDALNFCIPECLHVTLFLHFGPWFFIFFIFKSLIHTSSQTTQFFSEITCLFMLLTT